MMPLTFVTWKWKPVPGYRSQFGPDTVNILKRMIDRHYDAPHRVCCVTDDAKGIDKSIEVIPDWKDFAKLPPPSGGRNPSCFRRLRAFHPDIAQVFGPRFVSMDLDVVITADLKPLLDRPEDFVIYGDTNPRTFFNGSFFLLKAGSRAQVWNTFDPVRSPQLARAAGHMGSDQAWISYCLGPKEAKWTHRDGVYSYRNHIEQNGKTLPKDARLVVFHGNQDPWGQQPQKLDWVRRHYN